MIFGSVIAMNHATVVANLLAVWLIFQTSAMMIADKWDVEELSKQLHDPAKERIDLACDTCEVLVDAIQSLVRWNMSEDAIVSAITELCIVLKVKDSLVCSGIVPEFKVSARCYVYQQEICMVFVVCRMKFSTCSLLLLLDRRRFVVIWLVEVVDIIMIPGNKIGLSHFLMWQSPHPLTDPVYQKLVTH